MTVVDSSPALGPAIPRRRALLPRNPTPWVAPSAQSLPPQVQRILQQVAAGGSPYRSYQPFQVAQPFVFPPSNPVPTFHGPAAAASHPQQLDDAGTNCSTTAETNCTATAGTTCSATAGTTCSATAGTTCSTTAGTTCPPTAAQQSQPPPARVPATGSQLSPAPLIQLCRGQLVAHYGLRALKQLLQLTGAPASVSRFLSTVSAQECIARSPAPLLDVFAEPFFHRTVTWRVVCSLDGQPYLATYAHTDVASQDCRWLSPTEAGDGSPAAWLRCDHPHIMRVWGLVVDDVTGNTFYLLDTPIATLHQLQSRLTQVSARVPEQLIWSVVSSVSSALCHALAQGLCYPALHLSNIFLLHRAIAVENGLTRKQRIVGCGCPPPSPLPETCLVHHLGQVILALMTCHLRTTCASTTCTSTTCTSTTCTSTTCTSTTCTGTTCTSGHQRPALSCSNIMKLLSEEYSSVLLHLLSRSLSGGVARAWAAAGAGQDEEPVCDPRTRWDQHNAARGGRRPVTSTRHSNNSTAGRDGSSNTANTEGSASSFSQVQDARDAGRAAHMDRSTRPKTKPADHELAPDKRRKKRQSSNTHRRYRNSGNDCTLKENLSPSARNNSNDNSNRSNNESNLGGRTRDSKSEMKGGGAGDRSRPLLGSGGGDSCSPTVTEIAQLAEEQLWLRCGAGVSLQDALQACPQQLVQLALSQQP